MHVQRSISAVLLQVVSTADWKKISHCAWDQPHIQMFWEHLDEISNEQLLRVLAFCTGMNCLPIGGFGALGEGFIIESDPDPNRLPVAHTCSFSLDLPCYGSKEVLVTYDVECVVLLDKTEVVLSSQCH